MLLSFGLEYRKVREYVCLVCSLYLVKWWPQEPSQELGMHAWQSAMLHPQVPFASQFLLILLSEALSSPSVSFHTCCHFPSCDPHFFSLCFCNNVLMGLPSPWFAAYKFILYPEARVPMLPLPRQCHHFVPKHSDVL